MSTIKTVNVQHPSSVSANVALDSSGNVGVGTATPGSKLDVKGTVRLSGATSGYVGLAPAAAAGSTTYTLPSADGAANAALTTDGAGTLSWAARVNSLTAGNGVTVSAATGDVTVALDYYTGTSATNTSFPIGSIVFVQRTSGSGSENLNQTKTLYVRTSASEPSVYDATSTGRTALTGTWRNRGVYNGLSAITSIDWVGQTSTTTSYYFGVYQRTA